MNIWIQGAPQKEAKLTRCSGVDQSGAVDDVVVTETEVGDTGYGPAILANEPDDDLGCHEVVHQVLLMRDSGQRDVIWM